HHSVNGAALAIIDSDGQATGIVHRLQKQAVVGTVSKGCHTSQIPLRCEIVLRCSRSPGAEDATAMSRTCYLWWRWRRSRYQEMAWYPACAVGIQSQPHRRRNLA